VLRKRHKGRDAPFGNIELPKCVLRRNLKDLFSEVRHQRCLADKSATRVFPLKTLRSRFLKVTSLEVITQPVGCLSANYTDLKPGIKIPEKCTVVRNPLWDVAPPGAYFKAKRLGSLVNDIVTFGGNAKLSKQIERLAIKIWQLSKRSFVGLCRSIRANIAHSLERESTFRKSPESLVRPGALTRNPLVTQSKKRYTQYLDARRCPGCASQRLSTCVDVVRNSLKCKKCTRAACAARWFTPCV